MVWLVRCPRRRPRRRGELPMLPPDHSRVHELAAYDGVPAVLAATRHVVPLMPRAVVDGNDVRLVLDGSRAGVSAPARRDGGVRAGTVLQPPPLCAGARAQRRPDDARRHQHLGAARPGAVGPSWSTRVRWTGAPRCRRRASPLTAEVAPVLLTHGHPTMPRGPPLFTEMTGAPVGAPGLRRRERPPSPTASSSRPAACVSACWRHLGTPPTRCASSSPATGPRC